MPTLQLIRSAATGPLCLGSRSTQVGGLRAAWERGWTAASRVMREPELRAGRSSKNRSRAPTKMSSADRCLCIGATSPHSGDIAYYQHYPTLLRAAPSRSLRPAQKRTFADSHHRYVQNIAFWYLDSVTLTDIDFGQEFRHASHLRLRPGFNRGSNHREPDPGDRGRGVQSGSASRRLRNRVHVLIATKLDRLGRNAIDVATTVARVSEMGVRVHCLALAESTSRAPQVA
jgi:hypothetical protein